MINFKVENVGDVEIDKIPNECPYCHNRISPTYFGGRESNKNLELILICPDLDCKKSFIAVYLSKGGYDIGSKFISTYHFNSIAKITLKAKHFSDTINIISTSFVKIYNEAYFAEQQKLEQICGVGYRKALEFLIKDYLISINPKKEETNNIKKLFIGQCIKKYITDPKITIAASRAVWLGNDETHYIRKWEGKDLNDLKKLIDLTIHWIEMEELTKEIVEDMPEKK